MVGTRGTMERIGVVQGLARSSYSLQVVAAVQQGNRVKTPWGGG